MLSCDQNVSTIDLALVKNTINVEAALDDLSDDFSKQIDSTWFITLKSPEENILGQISKIIVHDNKIYALDILQAMKLNVYSMTGKYLATVSRKGKAENEYLKLVDFDVTDDRVILLDRNNESVMNFSNETYKYINSIKIVLKPSHFAVLNEGYVFQVNPFLPLKETENKSIATTDLSGNNRKYYIDAKQVNLNAGTHINVDHQFFRKDSDCALYYSVLYDYIFKCDMNGVDALYAIDFGKYSVPLEERLDRLKFQSSPNSDNYAYMSATPKVTDNDVFLTIIKGNDQYMILYNIEKNEATTVKADISNLNIENPYGAIGAYSGDLLVSLVDDYILEECRKAGQKIDIEQTDTSSIIMFTKFK